MAVRRKRLKKSKDKIIAGVIGGIADHFNTDPTLLRIAWLVIIAFTGFIPGIIAYFVAYLIMPSAKK